MAVTDDRKYTKAFVYNLLEGVKGKTLGGMAFPDYLDRPSRTIITGEGGPSASRFKHVVLTPSGRYRRLIPIELERLNMFPDNHTFHPEGEDKDPRLVFELEYLESLPQYVHIDLNIFRTYRDTLLGRIMGDMI